MERGTQEQYELYPSSPLGSFLFPSPPFAVPDFDVALLVMPYFSWPLNPNGKFSVTKRSVHRFNFICDFKRWSSYSEVTLAL